jgi:hypothetical protein
MLHGAVWRLQGQGNGNVELKLCIDLPIPPMVSRFLFADSERVLLLAGYGTPWVPFGVL